MARKTSRAPKQRAQKCRLTACKRTVRVDNPTFPYCHDHVHLKTLRSGVVDLSQRSMETIRDMLYNPPKSGISRGRATITAIANRSHLLDTDVANGFSSWAKHTVKEGIDTTDSIQAFNNRDEILSAVSSDMSAYCDVETLDCHGGRLIVPGVKQPQPLDDHKILHVTHDDEDFIIDPATAAPLHNTDEKLRRAKNIRLIDVYRRHAASMPCFDGLNISSMVEYAAFNYSTFTTITDPNGDIMWDNRVHDNNTLNEQRRLVESVNYVSAGVDDIHNSFIEEYIRRQDIPKQDDSGGRIPEHRDTGSGRNGDLTLEDILRQQGVRLNNL